VNEVQRRSRLEDLFNAHAGAVRAYARRRVDPVAADDAVSEVFVIAWRRLDDVPDDALPWLLGCARHVLEHQQRRSGRDLALLDRLAAAGVPDSSLGVPDSTLGGDHVLSRALAQLSPQDRELLLLIAWEGLQPRRAAQVMGCSCNALAVRLHRARKRLAAALSAADADDRPGPRPRAEEAV
jgi:RNA polymerase sigma-70 factor (ECF subfamily)